ncbi:MAG: PorT family protein [Hymenobacter sp.]|nr:MAG: PorT family protein [Hymenobacter sp.]
MTRFLLLLGSSLLVTGTAQAQFGLRVGGSLSQLHTTTGTNLYSRSSAQLGYQVGVTYQLPLTAWLALVPELQYSDERTTLSEANYTLPDLSFNAESRLRLHYLNVPVLVRATLGPVYIEVGPQASCLVGGRQTGTTTAASVWGPNGQPYTDSHLIDQPITQGNQRFDVGPCVGVGAKLPAGLGLSVRAYRGLRTLNQERQFLDGEHQRQTLQASLTYQLLTHK